MLKLSNPTRPTTLDELLESPLVTRLGALDITSRKILAGKLKGERRSKRRGESVEFADHRPYVVGDDLRHIDWNIFGRLDRLFLKLFLEEEDLSLHVVMDASGSHDAGAPSKFVLMQKLAVGLGYVGLANLHRVNAWMIGGEAVAATRGREGAGLEGAGEGESAGAVAAGGAATEQAKAPPRVLTALRDLRGKRRLNDLGRFVLQTAPGGAANFTEACKRIALSRRGKGVMVVLSDFFIKEGYEAGLRLLSGRGYDLFAVQVLAPQEIKPEIGGDLRLKDCEDGDVAEVTITAPLLKKYVETLEAYNNLLREFCARREIMHMTVSSDAAVDTLILDHLRRRGLVA